MVDCSKVKPVAGDCPCTCEGGGWCEPHQIVKTAHYVHLCRTNESYRRAWNECRGPRQGFKGLHPYGPGTELRRLLGCDVDGRGCKWHVYFRKMNDWGPAECRKQVDTIANWIRTLDIEEPTARRMVRLAIEGAERRAEKRKDAEG